MPHAKEHPLAGRRVVPDAMTGASLYIVDWLDRLPGGLSLMHPDHPVARAFRRASLSSISTRPAPSWPAPPPASRSSTTPSCRPMILCRWG